MLRRTDDFSYRKLLHKEDVVFLESYTKNCKVPSSKQKPRELIAKLQQEIVKEKCGSIKLTDTSDHMDDYLQQLADKQNVQIFGLESYSDQIDAINNNKEELSWDKAKEIVSLYIVDAKTEEKKRLKQICALSTDYMKMKLDYQLNIKCTENDEMLSNRNERWMPKIKQSIEENSSVFIAVGFYHLFGECGIISQLRKEGYDVKPIKLK